MKRREPGFATKAIHVGQEPDPSTGAITVPIFATSTYVQQDIGKNKGYEYARVSNPTRTCLEQNLAALEGGSSAHVFSSGMAAVTAVTQCFLKQGDHLICGHDTYGGVPRFFNQVVANYGVEFSYVNTSDPDAVKKAMRRNTKIVWIETPTNPLMVLTDIREIARIAHAGGAELAVDNTFMSPYLQQPLALGADMVMHSTTKFLNGHSDGLGGVIVGTKPHHAEKLAFMQKASGGILSPFECWLVLRGVKSLAARMVVHDGNGRAVASYLTKHRKVKKVLYPGLPEHPQHELAKRQMKGFGSMITFETGSLKNASKMLRKVRICSFAESLGGVETLISHPATMTHAALGEAGRKKIGLTDGMVRISVGVEDAEDIIADLDQALAAI
ncbi:MAG TPA: PLP-dependent aspartate aminotransferase family protein [Candidatus Angelobacter sp.]|jgi:cystathionine gamma-lyase/cystathionine beta-lyase/cystathionine gamma-lyase/homocysteine desulfhydrase|nr:PLP-dependent aspartate aminotransferase family protein [Candidatus Angelobacter sp.]